MKRLPIYGVDTLSAIADLQDIIDVDKATAVWNKAINSKWNKDPVWIHGDFASGNFLIKDNQLAAVIDFGCMGVGDPACDLVLAWAFLKNESREIFKKAVALDSNTWARARGWALWKASFELTKIEDKASSKAIKQLQVIRDILAEH